MAVAARRPNTAGLTHRGSPAGSGGLVIAWLDASVARGRGSRMAVMDSASGQGLRGHLEGASNPLRFVRWRRAEGQAEDEEGTAVGGVAGCGRTTVFGRDGGHDGKAKAGAGSGPCCVGSPEAIKQVGLGVGI